MVLNSPRVVRFDKPFKTKNLCRVEFSRSVRNDIDRTQRKKTAIVTNQIAENAEHKIRQPTINYRSTTELLAQIDIVNDRLLASVVTAYEPK